MEPMIDHFGINCSDLAASAAFYDKVLGVLGFTGSSTSGWPSATAPGKPDFWISTQPDRGPVVRPQPRDPRRLRGRGRGAVRAFFDAAVARRRGPARAPLLAGVPRPLLRRLRPRPRRQQRRGRLPHGGAGVVVGRFPRPTGEAASSTGSTSPGRELGVCLEFDGTGEVRQASARSRERASDVRDPRRRSATEPNLQARLDGAAFGSAWSDLDEPGAYGRDASGPSLLPSESAA